MSDTIGTLTFVIDTSSSKTAAEAIQAELLQIGETATRIASGVTGSMGSAFKNARTEIINTRQAQQEALAGMIAFGQAGTAEYTQLVSHIRETAVAEKALEDATRKAQEIMNPPNAGAAFSSQKRALQDQIAQEKLHLASLNLTGNAGTAEYHKIEQSIKSAQSELKAFDAAEKTVEKDLNKPAPKGLFDGLKHEFGDIKNKFNEDGGLAGVIANPTQLFSSVQLVTQGIGMIKEGVKELFEAGAHTIEGNKLLLRSFRQAGESMTDAQKDYKATGAFAYDLSLKVQLPAGRIKELSAQAAFTGGATGKLNRDLTTLAATLEKGSGGFIDGTTAIRAFTKGLNDPEGSDGIGRLAMKYPDLASKLKGVSDTSDKVRIALEYLKSTQKDLAEEANEPIGAVENIGNAFKSLQGKLGEAFIGSLGFIVPVLNGITNFILKTVIPGINQMIPVIKFISEPFRELTQTIIDNFGLIATVIATYFLPALIPIGIAIADLAGTFLLVVAAIKIVIGIFRPLGELFDQVTDNVGGATSIFDGLWDTIKEKGFPILKEIGQVLETVGEVIGTFLILPIKLAYTYFSTLFTVIVNIVKGLFNFSSSAKDSADKTSFFTKALNFVTEALDYVQAGLKATESFIKEFGDVFVDFGNIIKNVSLSNIRDSIDKIIKLFSDAPKRVGDAASNAFKDSLHESDFGRQYETTAKAYIESVQKKFDDLKITQDSDLGKKTIEEAKVLIESIGRGIDPSLKFLKGKIEDSKKELDEILENAARDKDTKGGKKEADDFYDKLKSITAATTKASGDAALQAIQDQAEREKLALKNKYADQLKAAQDYYNQTVQGIKESAKTKVPVIDFKDEKGNLIKEISGTAAVVKEFTDSYGEQRKAINAALAQDLLAADAKSAVDRFNQLRKDDEDAIKLTLDTEKKRETLIRGASLDAIKQRQALQREELVNQQALDLSSAVTSSRAYQEGVKDIQDQVRKGLLDPKDVGASLTTLYSTIKNNDENIKTLRAVQIDALTQQQRDGYAVLETSRINLISDIDEKAYEQKKFDLKKQFDSDLDLVKGNADLEARVKAKYDDLSLVNEKDYQGKRLPIYRSAVTAIGALEEEFSKTLRATREERNNEETKLLDLQITNNRELFDKGVEDYSDYIKKLDELDADRNDSQNRSASIAADLAKATGIAIARGADKFVQGQRESLGKLVDDLNHAKGDIGDTALSIGKVLLSVGAQAAIGADNAKKVVLTTAFDILQSLVPILSAQIIAISLAQPLSVITAGTEGFVQAGILTAVLEGVVGVARSAAGYYEGGYTGHGDPRRIAGPAHMEEFVFPHWLTSLYRSEFENILSGQDPYTVFGSDDSPIAKSVQMYESTHSEGAIHYHYYDTGTAAAIERQTQTMEAHFGKLHDRALDNSVKERTVDTMNSNNVIEAIQSIDIPASKPKTDDDSGHQFSRLGGR